MIIAILFLRMGPVTGCLPSVLASPIPPWALGGGTASLSPFQRSLRLAASPYGRLFIRQRPKGHTPLEPPTALCSKPSTPSAAGVAGEHPGLGWVGATHSNLMKIVITDLKLLALPFLDLSITSLMLNPEERVFSCPDES
jgi:hypothetical protein